MRFLIATGMVLLALAFAPLAANGAGSGGGSKGGGSTGSRSMGSDPHPDNQNNGWRNGYPWYGENSPRYDNGYGYRGNAHIVERPVLENPLPGANFSGDPIQIVNPASSRATLSYKLNGFPYRIQPGESQDLREDREWVIEFNRGGNFGLARYGLQPGLHSFSVTEHGWELYRTPFEAPTASTGNAPAPTPRPPANPAPSPTPVRRPSSEEPEPTPRVLPK
jgi:hypothetical protein